jgi:hypothetical protein
MNLGNISSNIACTCYHPLSVFNQYGDVERCTLRPSNVHKCFTLPR